MTNHRNVVKSLMRKSTSFFAITLLLGLTFLHNKVFAQSYWQQYVHYKINATLDTKEHKIESSGQLFYKNNSPDTLDVVYFRLYWNLFTPESYGRKFIELRKLYFFDVDTAGGIWIKKFTIIKGETEYAPTYFIDNALMEVSLPKPLLPGDSLEFRFEFVENIPKIGLRTGHDGRDYCIGQWYPQIATYDKYGWDKTQYMLGEFHNEFGTFDVSITIPRSFTVGYTGTLLNPEEVYPDSVLKKLAEAKGQDTTIRIADYSNHEWKDEDSVLVTWKFHAENVRDFAWTANEHYIWDVTHWSSDSTSEPIAIHALYFPDKAEFWKDVAQYGRHSIQLFSKHFGRYEYPSMFIVETGVSGGIEYPGIVFIGHIGDKISHILHMVVAHEIAHNWYPMMVGTNETYYPFMDEGLASFMTGMAVEDYYGPKDNLATMSAWYLRLLGIPNDNARDYARREYFDIAKTGYEEPLATNTYRFNELHSISSIYTKTASVLIMLNYVLGDSVFKQVMIEFYNRWKFKHPYPEDFYAIVQEKSGNRDMRWFFDQWFNRTYTCDYGICNLHSEPLRKGDGTIFRTTFTVRRYGKAIMPLDIKISMADGSDTTIWIPVDSWFNAQMGIDTTIDLPSKPIRGEINPDGQIADINRLNNTTTFPKIKLQFDNTIFSVTPIDAYLLKWRPSFWYTDRGGINFGYKINGSYLNDQYGIELYQLYNTRDKTMNYDLTLTHSPYTLSPLSQIYCWLWRMEGRKGLSFGLWKGLRRNYTRPPYHEIQLTYSYSQVDEPEYALIPYLWQTGPLQRTILTYRYYNRGRMWTADARATFDGAANIFGRSDFIYTKRTFDIKFTLNMPLGWLLAGRYYNGGGLGNIPNQSKYYFASSSPIEQMSGPLLRSKGILPKTLHEHALHPGGGNMRGYFNQLLFGEKIEAVNIEARFPTLIPFVRLNLPVVGYITKMFKSSVFFDAGRIASSSEKLMKRRYEVDYGFGVQLASLSYILGPLANSDIFSGLEFYTIRVDFPIYVSKPEANEKKLKYRWTVSFSLAF